tara:strand:+ start:305 stop:511 length:207 start_codon:yes stop_codon:yes gene_type:complete
LTNNKTLVIINVWNQTPLRFLEMGFQTGTHLEISHQNFFLNVMILTFRGAKYYMRITDFNNYFTVKEV